MPDNSVKLRTIEGGVPKERDPLAFLGGVLPQTPIVRGGKPTTVGGALDDIATTSEAAIFTRAAIAPAGFRVTRSVLDDEGRFVDEFGPVDTPENTTATFQRAFDFYAARGGGKLRLRLRVYEISALMQAVASNFTIEGCGGFKYPDPDANPNNTSGYGTVLRWVGAAGGTMLVVAPVPGPTAKPLSHVRISGIGLDGNYNRGGIGILCGTVNNSVIEVNGIHWTDAVADFRSVSQLAPGSPSDCQNNDIRVGGHQVVSGLIARFDGDPTHATFGNFCKNRVFLYGAYKYNDAVHVKNSDTNVFEAQIGRYGAGPGETLTARGLVMFGGGTQYNDFCRSNKFYGLWGAGGAHALGTESGYTVPAGSSVGGGLGDNTIEVDVFNLDPYPRIETGCRLLTDHLTGDREFGVVKANGRRAGPPSGSNDTNGVLIAQSGLGGQVSFGQYDSGAERFRMWLQGKGKQNNGALSPIAINPIGANVELSMGTWDGGHVLIGVAHLWNDTLGYLRFKTSPPTSANDGVILSGKPPAYTFDTLPAGPPGLIAYCSDAREPGQAAGAGTGMLVFLNAGGWRSAAGGPVQK